MWSPSPPFAVPSPATNTRRDALVFAPQGQGQQKSFLRMFNSNQRNRRVPKTEQKRNITRKTLSSGNINQRLNLQSAGGNTCFRERLRHLNNVHRLHFRTSNARVHDGSKYGRTRVPDMTLSFWNLNDKPTWETFFVATRNQWKRPAFKTSSRGPVRCGLRRSQETWRRVDGPKNPRRRFGNKVRVWKSEKLQRQRKSNVKRSKHTTRWTPVIGHLLTAPYWYCSSCFFSWVMSRSFCKTHTWTVLTQYLRWRAS